MPFPRAALAAAALLCAGCLHFPASRALVSAGATGRVVIHDVAVFPATSTARLEHQDVVVEAGLIAEVRPTRREAGGGTVIEGAGKTLLPGLVDVHVHLTMTAAPPWYLVLPDAEHNLQAHLFAGVTTVNDVGGSLEELREVRRHVAEGQWLGPRVFYSGPNLTHQGGYPASMIQEVYGPLAVLATTPKLCTQVTSAAQAALEVRRRFAEGASLVKITVASIPEGAPRLTAEELRGIVAQAHQLGLKVAAHIDTSEDAMLAARAGVDLLAHGVETSLLTEAEAAELARLHVTVATTLVNYQRFCELRAGTYTPDALKVAAEPAALLEQFGPAQVAAATLSPAFTRWGDAIAEHQADRLVNARRLFDAGVTVVAGSDAQGSVGTFASDLHGELELLVQAGLPPAEVLLGATSRAAALLQANPSFGTVEVGKSADLLLIDGNPLEDITVTRRIALVMARGQVMNRR